MFNEFWLNDEFQLLNARQIILIFHFYFREAADTLKRLQAERDARNKQ